MVESIFLAGSGIPNRLDFLLPDAPPAEAVQRIRALSNFQLTILSHAMRFSGARRVVYSTCSIWGQEDEGVVVRVTFHSLAFFSTWFDTDDIHISYYIRRWLRRSFRRKGGD